MNPIQKITIYDLAKELNTSASTVSRALQNHPRISEKMKKAVQELAEKRNYHPDPVAHHLRTGKGSVIGVIVPRIDRHFFASVIGGIESVAHAAGYGVLVSQSNERWEDEKSIVKTMIAKKIDGLAVSLASETTDYKHFDSIISRGVPVVFFDRVPLTQKSSCVKIDNRSAAYDAVMHLVEQGCRRIVHLSGPQAISVYKDRQEGYEQALSDSGIKVDSSLIFENSITLVTGEAAGKEILNMTQLPDAIFSAGDYSAMGVMHVLKRNGIRIPEDVAIVGFANEPFDSFVDPPLTSVDQMNKKMGEAVAEVLLKEMAYDPENRIWENRILEPKLIIRESSLKKDNLLKKDS
ncbi:LacI family DNA-binding transcriptional regulator [Coprobacter sp.]